MPFTKADQMRGHAERGARTALARLTKIGTYNVPIRPETRDALLSAVVALPAAPASGKAKKR